MLTLNHKSYSVDIYFNNKMNKLALLALFIAICSAFNVEQYRNHIESTTFKPRVVNPMPKI